MLRKLLRCSVFLVMFMTLSAVCFFSASAAGYVTKGNFIYYVDGSKAVVAKYNGNEEKVSVPSKVSSATIIGIANNAFSTKKSIKTLTLPSTLLTIGKSSFKGCTGLTKLVLPAKLRTISSNAFYGCSNLEGIYIPPSVTGIASNAFTGCKKLTAYVIEGSYAEKYAKASKDVKLGYRYVSSLTVGTKAFTLAASSSKKIAYTVKPSNVYNKNLIYRSSNTKVATVSSTGVVKAVSCGKAVISMMTADGSKKTAKVTVTVVPQKVTGLKQIDSNVSGFTISWKASKGALAYAVYRLDTAKNSWVLVKTTSSLSYTATGLKTGFSSYYRVTAYSKINNSTFKASPSDKIKASVLTPGKVSGIKTESSSSTVKLTWKQATNASGYLVYRYNSSTKAYELIGNTPKLTATVRNLSANSKQTFAIRSYIVYQGKTVQSPDIVKDITAYTLPSKVSKFAVEHDSVTAKAAKLSWSRMTGVDGYEIYSCDSSGGSRKLLTKLTDNSVTGYTVTSLKAGQNSYFRIRAYVKRDKVCYGPLSSVLTVTPLSLPSNNKEAFNGFIKALNASKNSEADFYLIKSTEVSGLTGNRLQDCKEVTDAVAVSGITKYSFKKGIEEVTALPATHYISPANSNSGLTYSKLKSFTFKDEKDGYSVTINLDSEKDTLSAPAVINPMIAPTVNWYGLVTGFTLNNCLYEGTSITAKVKNGKIDSMTIVMPMQYTFRYRNAEYSIAETVTNTYIFGW